jgi:hypothetical protein
MCGAVLDDDDQSRTDGTWDVYPDPTAWDGTLALHNSFAEGGKCPPQPPKED